MGGAMKREFSIVHALCSEYQSLLHECQIALEAWHDRRTEIRKARLTGLQVGRELLTLQAHYAKAYNDMRKHTEHCEQCQLALPSAERESRSGTLDRNFARVPI
jgi:hypothetical protein